MGKGKLNFWHFDRFYFFALTAAADRSSFVVKQFFDGRRCDFNGPGQSNFLIFVRPVFKKALLINTFTQNDRYRSINNAIRCYLAYPKL